ncbi:MAG: dual specificity protein phosphatase family protein [Sediminispirochaetaceae bacterium]
MTFASRLPIEGLHDIFLSSHPLEGVRAENAAAAVRIFIQRIHANQVRTIVVLLPSHELRELYGDIDLLEMYRDEGLDVIHFPLENFSIPEKMEWFHGCIGSIEEKLRQGHVLIHCMAGCGRTGMMAAGVLVKLGLNAAEAIEQVRQTRPGSMDVLKQILFLRGYQRFLRESC